MPRNVRKKEQNYIIIISKIRGNHLLKAAD